MNDNYKSLLLTDGYFIVEDVFSQAQMAKLRNIFPQCLERAIADDVTKKDIGRLLVAPYYHPAFLDLLEDKSFLKPFESIFDGNFYLYVYSTSCLPPKQGNFSSTIHVDRKIIIPGYIEMVGALVLVDDFTEENGATWYLPGYFDKPSPPDEDYFFKNAKRLVAKAGSVFYFNSTLWHSGGINKTDKWRNAVAMAIVRPYLKQRIDIPSVLQHTNLSEYSDKTRHLLGFDSVVPKSIKDFYSNNSLPFYKK